MLILLDPVHMKKALGSSELDANIFNHINVMRQMMCSPQAAVDYYRTPGHDLDRQAMLQIRTQTTGTELISMDTKFLEIFEHNISKILIASPKEGWIDVPDLYTFFKHQVTPAIGEILLGSAIVQSCPRLAEDLWTFIESTYVFLLGLPRIFAPAAHGARDRLLEHIKTWGRKSDALREKIAVDKAWDDVTGSTLMQEREQMFAPLRRHGEDGERLRALVRFTEAQVLVSL